MEPHHFWLTDTQFERLKRLLPNKERGVKRVDDRRVISGIIHVIRNGLMWRDAPASYGPAKTLYNRPKPCIIASFDGAGRGYSTGFSPPWRPQATRTRWL